MNRVSAQQHVTRQWNFKIPVESTKHLFLHLIHPLIRKGGGGRFSGEAKRPDGGMRQKSAVGAIHHQMTHIDVLLIRRV